MAIPLVMNDLSVTPASNSPAGSESPSNGDDFLRAQGAILRTTNAKGSDIASSATTDIGAATAEFVDVTGTTTITGLGTIGAGIRRTVRFTGILTLTYNATSLILPGSANITTAVGDVAQFRSLGSGNWLCTGYTRRNGYSISDESRSTIAVHATTTPIWTAGNGNILDVTGTATITDFPDATQAGARRICYFTANTILTDNANIDVEGDANYTIVDGDKVEIEALTTSTFKAWITRKDGTPIFVKAGVQGDHASDLIINNDATTPNSKVNVSATEVVVKDTSGRSQVISFNDTADITVSGANGLDTGSEAADTWYFIWAISNGVASAGDSLLSASSTAPTMPSGYTHKAIVGAIYNDGSSNFVRIRQEGNRVQYTTHRTVLNGGATTSAWTSVNVTTFYPSTAKSITMAVGVTGVVAAGLSNNSNGAGGSYFHGGASASAITYSSLFPTARETWGVLSAMYGQNAAYYYTGTATTSFIAIGWEY